MIRTAEFNLACNTAPSGRTLSAAATPSAHVCDESSAPSQRHERASSASKRIEGLFAEAAGVGRSAESAPIGSY